MHCNGLKLSCALEVFYKAKKSKNQIFEENKGFECSFFFRIEVQVISTRLADLKNTKPLNFCLLTIFFKEKLIFCIFKNNQLQILKSLYAFYFMKTC